MEKKFDYIEEVETFLRRLRDGVLVFTSKATELRYLNRPSPFDNLLQYGLKTMSLSDCLNNALNAYSRARQEMEKKYMAKECHEWIQLAWLNGAIQEGQGLTKKLEECKAENIRMQQELADLSAKYLEKERLLEGFETKYGLDGKNKKS